MDTDEQKGLPDSAQEGEKPRPLTQDEEKLLIIMRHAAQEFTILHNAWNEFRNRVDGLAICQTELLGRPLNALTTSYEGLYNLIVGHKSPAMDSEQEASHTLARADVLKKILDHRSEHME